MGIAECLQSNLYHYTGLLRRKGDCVDAMRALESIHKLTGSQGDHLHKITKLHLNATADCGVLHIGTKSELEPESDTDKRRKLL